MSNKRKEKIVTEVAIVLDCSGSMHLIEKETIAGFNKQIEEFKEKVSEDNEVNISLFTFDTFVQTKFISKPVNEVKNLTEYVPSGSTAMYDGVGVAIKNLSVKDVKPVKVKGEPKINLAFLVIIISDGEENSSVDYTAEDIAKLVIEKQKTKKWTFVYIGANQDLSEVKKQTGFSAGNLRAFNNTSAGTTAMYESVAKSTSNYMAERSRGITQSLEYFKETDSEEN